MKQRKWWQLLSLLMLLVCLVGCAVDPPSAPETTGAAPEEAPGATGVPVTTEDEIPTEASETTEEPVSPEVSVAPAPDIVEPLVTTELSEEGIQVLRIPDTARRGETVSLTIRGVPNTEYTLRVQYSSGWLKDEGLGTKPTDAAGEVTWTWTVGERAPFGTCPIEISGNGQTVYTRLTVVE